MKTPATAQAEAARRLFTTFMESLRPRFEAIAGRTQFTHESFPLLGCEEGATAYRIQRAAEPWVGIVSAADKLQHIFEYALTVDEMRDVLPLSLIRRSLVHALSPYPTQVVDAQLPLLTVLDILDSTERFVYQRLQITTDVFNARDIQPGHVQLAGLFVIPPAELPEYPHFKLTESHMSSEIGYRLLPISISAAAPSLP